MLHPREVHALLEKVTEATIAYLKEQLVRIRNLHTMGHEMRYSTFVSSLVFMSFLLEGLTLERSLCYVNRQRGNPPAPLSPAADFT
jgi:hypothetical protein